MIFSLGRITTDGICHKKTSFVLVRYSPLVVRVCSVIFVSSIKLLDCWIENSLSSTVVGSSVGGSSVGGFPSLKDGSPVTVIVAVEITSDGSWRYMLSA